MPSLRHQVQVLRRSVRRPELKDRDRVLLAATSRMLSRDGGGRPPRGPSDQDRLLRHRPRSGRGSFVGRRKVWVRVSGVRRGSSSERRRMARRRELPNLPRPIRPRVPYPLRWTPTSSNGPRVVGRARCSHPNSGTPAFDDGLRSNEPSTEARRPHRGPRGSRPHDHARQRGVPRRPACHPPSPSLPSPSSLVVDIHDRSSPSLLRSGGLRRKLSRRAWRGKKPDRRCRGSGRSPRRRARGDPRLRDRVPHSL